MKLIYSLIFSLMSLSGFGQIDTVHANFMFNKIDESVLIADCDTFNIVFDFSSDQFIERMPILISRDYNPSLSEYWLNESTLTLTEDNPYWNLKIYVDSTLGSPSSDFLRFKLVDNDNDDDSFVIYFLPEIPCFDVVPLFDEDNFVLCEYGNANFRIEFDSLLENTPYQFDFYDTNTESVLELFGDELYFDDWWDILISPELNIEVRTLNCSQSLASYPVLQRGFASLDTIICKNDTIDFFAQQVSYPTNMKDYVMSSGAENGCDSILTLNIDYLPVDFEVQQVTKTPEESILFHDSLIVDYGTYLAHSQNIHGCDSSEILSLIPLETLDYISRLPNQIETYASLCEEGICIPFYVPNKTDYRYIVNDVLYEYDDLGYCSSGNNVQNILSINLNPGFITEATPYRLEYVEINSSFYPDIYFSSIQELVNGLNAAYPAGKFAKGYADGEIFSFNPAIRISFVYRNLETFDRKFLNPSSVTSLSFLAGINLPLEKGFNDFRIEHKTQDFAKDIKVFVASPLVYLDGTLRIDYLPELNNKVQFPLPYSVLCDAISSARLICPENWEGIVDYTLTEEGVLTFEALKPYNLSLIHI